MKTVQTILFLSFTSLILFFFPMSESQRAFAQSSDPVLYFSDITSGLKTGNSDASSGRTPNVDGAIVTIWGHNLGSTQGSSKVTCNGADASSIYSWGNATSPANLFAFHQMQMISFQVSHLAQDGAGEISVTVTEKRSNALPFTVRAGNIYFVKTTGDDNNGNGSWVQPWGTIQKAASSLAIGDIAYILDGITDTTIRENDACISLDSDGSTALPKALIVYPNATVTVGSDFTPRAFWNYDAVNDIMTTNWVISKFIIKTSEVGIYMRDGFRVICNWFTAPRGDGQDGVINVEGSDVFVLGNEFFDCGSATSDKKYHTIYGKGIRKDEAPRAPTESGRDIGWNYIHDNKSNRAINIYSEQANSAYIEGHRVHDNVIVNQRGDGIMLGYYVTGDNWIYNNLIIRAGLGPEWSDPSYHVGIRINTGHENVNKTDVYCYNNTLYGCGFPGAIFPEETGHILISPEAVSLSTNVRLSNNIIYSTGEPYIAGESTSLAIGNHKNCWFGNSTAPSWDTGALNSDPLFINANGNNFQLNKNSPCINTGLDVTSVVTQDLLGVRREKAGCDLGVYEFTQTTAVEQRPYLNFGASIELSQSYPNPIISSDQASTITFTVPEYAQVKLSVVDNLGNEIAVLVDEMKDQGRYQTQFNPSSLPSGTYYYVLQSSSGAKMKKVMVVR